MCICTPTSCDTQSDVRRGGGGTMLYAKVFFFYDY